MKEFLFSDDYKENHQFSFQIDRIISININKKLKQLRKGDILHWCHGNLPFCGAKECNLYTCHNVSIPVTDSKIAQYLKRVILPT